MLRKSISCICAGAIAAIGIDCLILFDGTLIWPSACWAGIGAV
jgi:hypothetical protein